MRFWGRRRDAIVIHRTDLTCTYCGGRGVVPDIGDWLPIFFFGVLGLLARRRVPCPRCDGTGIEPIRH